MATHTITNESQTAQTSTVKLSQNWEEEAEFNRFGLITVALLIVGCLGGITVGMGAIEYVWSLILVLIPTMTTLSLILGVGPMRYVIYATIASVIIDITLLVFFQVV